MAGADAIRPPTTCWKKNGRPDLVQDSADAVDHHRGQETHDGHQHATAEQHTDRRGHRGPRERRDPAVVGVRRANDLHQLVVRGRGRRNFETDAPSQRVDCCQPREIHRAVVHDAHRAGRGERRTTVGADDDRVVRDVDVAAIQPVRRRDELHLIRRVDCARSSRQIDFADPHRQVEHLGHTGVVGEIDRLQRGRRGGDRVDRRPAVLDETADRRCKPAHVRCR